MTEREEELVATLRYLHGWFILHANGDRNISHPRAMMKKIKEAINDHWCSPGTVRKAEKILDTFYSDRTREEHIGLIAGIIDEE